MQTSEKILIIPDDHGRGFWRKAVKDADSYDRIIFLGDYTDPYPNEGIDRETIMGGICDIMNFRERMGDKVIVLLGNHDLSYIDPSMPECRFDHVNGKQISSLFMDDITNFRIAHEEKIGRTRYIFSHSGIEMEWAKDCMEGVNADNVVDLINGKFLECVSGDIVNLSFLDKISRRRGGFDMYPSPVWGDINDMYGYLSNDEVDQIPNSYQIFAHTQVIRPIVAKDFACLDARRAFILSKDGITEMDGEPIPTFIG